MLRATPLIYPPAVDESATVTVEQVTEEIKPKTAEIPAGVPLLALDKTAAIRIKVPGGCRTCNHAKDAHLPAGYGHRERCACGCTAYLPPWSRLVRNWRVLVVAAVVLLMAVLQVLAVVWAVT